MSRGLGKIERAIVEALNPPPGRRANAWAFAAQSVALMVGELVPENSASAASRLVSVRRALASLERKGLVRRVRLEGRVRWGWQIMPNARKEEARRHRAERRRRR